MQEFVYGSAVVNVLKRGVIQMAEQVKSPKSISLSVSEEEKKVIVEALTALIRSLLVMAGRARFPSVKTELENTTEMVRRVKATIEKG